jgi:hypothetical protein
MKNLQYLLESTFTTKFNNLSEDELSRFTFVYLCVLSAMALDHKFNYDAKDFANALYSRGRFENFRAGADDLYNAVAVLGSKAAADRYGKQIVSAKLPELVTFMIRDIANTDYNIRKSERHLLGIQRALKLIGDVTLGEFRKNCQWWVSLDDSHRKQLLQRIETYLGNRYATSSAVPYVKRILAYYQTQV